jgi:hypothetical protein
MANDIRLMNVVAFDTAGNAVIQPLKRWKATLNQLTASLEVKCDSYGKVYDLRTQVIAVGVGESTKKVAIGKTLGRVALTGLLHGRHAAGADLRWGGIDRDESQEVFLMLDDTTTVTMEMDGDEFEELVGVLPDAAKEDDAQARAEKLMDRIKAMVADGERVLAELAEKHAHLQAEDATLVAQVDAGQSFDERHAARERRGHIAQQLAELATEQRAVTYDFAVIRATKELKAKKDGAAASLSPSVQPKPLAAPASAAPSVPTRQHAKSKASFMGKVAKLIIWLLGASVGLFFGMIFGGEFGLVGQLLTLSIFLTLGGWIALKMLAALMRR